MNAGATEHRVIRLLIADDEHLIRGALEALLGLEPDIEVVASADNGVTAAELALQTQPDICLLDLEMPQADGIEAARRILSTVNTRVIIVTRHARPGVLRRALEARVSGFVPKSTPACELADVIRDVADALPAHRPRTRRIAREPHRGRRAADCRATASGRRHRAQLPFFGDGQARRGLATRGRRQGLAAGLDLARAGGLRDPWSPNPAESRQSVAQAGSARRFPGFRRGSGWRWRRGRAAGACAGWGGRRVLAGG